MMSAMGMKGSDSGRKLLAASLVGLAGLAAGPLIAAEWSDTQLSVRYGTKFAEPYNNHPDGSRVDIDKIIFGLTHVSGYKYGSNFFNVDILQSDKNDPGDGIAGNPGAQEAYIVYRTLLDFGKVSGKSLKMTGVRGFGLTAGFDMNAKNDGYASKKRMFVIGPTVMFEVPGFLNLSALYFDESNAPNGIPSRYHYKGHGAVELDWGLPLGKLPLFFQGYALYIGSKGTNEFGGPTKPETHIDMSVMYDLGGAVGWAPKTFNIGVGFEYWKNKFGNPSDSANAGEGATARTPMIRFEYHF
jgi:hypothetical protein